MLNFEIVSKTVFFETLNKYSAARLEHYQKKKKEIENGFTQKKRGLMPMNLYNKSVEICFQSVFICVPFFFLRLLRLFAALIYSVQSPYWFASQTNKCGAYSLVCLRTFCQIIEPECVSFIQPSCRRCFQTYS